MAIKNASDLLVYKKTSPAQPQITRIKIKSSTPVKDFTSGQNIIINNITDANGDITDGETETIYTNTGTAILNIISGALSTVGGYSNSGTPTIDGVWRYVDYTNAADGPVPTLEIVDGSAEFKAGAIEIDVIQSGQSLVYQPIAYSTSASISMNTDLRDITTKDSQGWQENAKGLGSFEMSTDALWDVNNAVGVESATTDLIQGDSVDIKFSDRVRNLVATEEVYGPDEWAQTGVTLAKHLEDPFGQFTAAKVQVSVAGDYRALFYRTPIQLIEGKKITISIYIKGTSNNTSAVIKTGQYPTSGSGVNLTPISYGITGYQATVSITSHFVHIDNLSTSEWTRVYATYDTISGTDLAQTSTSLYPGDDSTGQTTSDEIITASWQIETGTSATDYQNPTEVDCYQGKAFVNSVSVDAGTEENATYSASFTGTSEIFINGLGHELIGDPYFDDPSYWTVVGSSVVEDGYGKIISTGADSQIQKTGIFTANEKYCLEYTVHTSTAGTITLIDGSGSDDVELPSSVGTHKVYINPGISTLALKRTSGTTTIWLSSISVKQVFS